MTTTDEHLGRFYIELQAWIDGRCEEHPVFALHRAICSAAMQWQAANLPETASIWTLFNAAGEQFVAAGLNKSAPFNGGDYDAWDFECAANRHYTNPARLAWIKEHAEAAKAAGLAERV